MSEIAIVSQNIAESGDSMANISEPPSPFNDPTADIILRSSDNVNFRVFKVILSQSSPFFHSMFTLPQPQSADNDSRFPQIVPMTEDHEIVDILLRVCYPVRSPVFDLDKASKILEAGRKYQMEPVLDFARDGMMKYAEEQPTRVYALACHFGFKEEVKAAARLCLRLSLDTLCTAQTEFDDISGQAFRSLVLYYIQCQEAAFSFSQSWKWAWATGPDYFWRRAHRDSTASCSVGARADSTGHGVAAPTWWFSYMGDLTTLLRSRPEPEDVKVSAEKMMKCFLISSAGACGTCRANAPSHIAEFTSTLSTNIRRAQSNVVLNLDHIVCT